MRTASQLAVAALLLLSTTLTARQHGMPIVVEPDRILIGGEFVPRFLDLPVVKTVAAGETDTLTAGVYDYIEVAGTLNVPDIDVSVTHLFVLPGGRIQIACGATITGRNVPINTDRDPFQWGNGLLNFGTLVASCPDKTPFVPIAEAAQGATTLSLSSQPVGWAVGDVVMVPDTRQMNTGYPANVRPRREANATITALSGSTLTLSTPLSFARLSVKRPDGSVVVVPRVANLSRQTVIQSENATGVRWHVANVGHDATWDVNAVGFVGVGRTKNEPLNNTSLGSNIGTNQVGRYAFHVHHVWTSLETRRITSSSFDGKNGGKWAVAIHQSHDTDVLNNVCVDTPGGCFITEDGNESRNVFRGNFAAFAVGNGAGSVQNVDAGCPGCESAYWFRGLGNVIQNNEAWNSQMGFNLFNQRHQGKSNPIPVAKGSSQIVVPNLVTMVPIAMTGNLTVSNAVHGHEAWSMTPFPNTDMTFAHNGQRQAWSAFPEAASHLYLVNAKVICANGTSLGVVSGQGYTQGVRMDGGEIRGCGEGLAHGIGRSYGLITDVTLQNVMNFSIFQPASWPVDLVFTRVRHEQFGTRPMRYIESTAKLPEWSGTGNPPADHTAWGLDTGRGPLITDWQGTGQNYRVAYGSQVSTSRAWTATVPTRWMQPPPECGTTMGASWSTCGMTLLNETFAATAPVTLSGMVGLVAIPETPRPLGLPRAIMTTPNSLGATTTVLNPDGRLLLNFALSGDPTKATNTAYLSIDGGPRLVANYRRGGPQAAFYVGYITTITANGNHTVRAWRELNGVEVPGSSMSFRYTVGNTPPPPDPVDCVLSPPSFVTSEWTLTGITYARTETESKTIVTAPQHGGAPCVP